MKLSCLVLAAALILASAQVRAAAWTVGTLIVCLFVGQQCLKDNRQPPASTTAA